jgi:hypothetical protein
MPGFLTFMRLVWPDVFTLLKILYRATGGDVERARQALRQMPDAWQNEDAFRAAVDAELRAMKAGEGK